MKNERIFWFLEYVVIKIRKISIYASENVKEKKF